MSVYPLDSSALLLTALPIPSLHTSSPASPNTLSHSKHYYYFEWLTLAFWPYCVRSELVLHGVVTLTWKKKLFLNVSMAAELPFFLLITTFLNYACCVLIIVRLKWNKTFFRFKFASKSKSTTISCKVSDFSERFKIILNIFQKSTFLCKTSKYLESSRNVMCV